jgi:hypothetical protein
MSIDIFVNGAAAFVFAKRLPAVKAYGFPPQEAPASRAY